MQLAKRGFWFVPTANVDRKPGPFLLGCTVVLALTGCGAQNPPASLEAFGATAPEEVWRTQEHNVGEMLAGKDVVHTFTFTNDLTTPLHIAQDKDVLPDCGCAGLKPAARSLAPGEKTSVTVTVATRDKSGPFCYGGRIAWTGGDDQVHLAVFKVHGVARPPLRTEPAELLFDRADVAKGRAKELTVILDPAVEPESLRVTAPEELFMLAKRPSPVKGRTVIAITAFPSPGRDEDDDLPCVIAARLTPQHGGLPVSIRVPLHVDRAAPLTVQPRRLAVRFDAGGKAVARCVLSGDALPGPEAIESITCTGYRVEWKPTRMGAAATTTIIDLQLFRPHSGSGPAESSLRVKVKNLDPVAVPVQVQE